MAKMFDKVSQDFLSAIKGVLEAKKLDPVGKENDDIDNDGDVDKSDKYLHNRRKAIKSAMMKKESAEQIDELSTKTLRSYRAKARDDAFDADAVDDDRRLRKRSFGHNQAGKKILKRGDTLRAEEVENLDELSRATVGRYSMKAKSIADNEGGKDRSKGRELAGRKRWGGTMSGVKPARVPATEEVQIDEISTKLAMDYSDKAADARGHRKLSTPKLDKRYKSMALAHEKIRGRHAKVPTTEEAELTPEEIAMIEAKLAGVADGSMEGDKHMCATKVFHKEWKEGTPIKTMHADPDADGLIEWYDVMFDHGIERVMTEEMEILQAESHMHSKKKMSEASYKDGETRMGSVGPITTDAERAERAKKYREKMMKKEEVEEIDESVAAAAKHLIKRYGDNVRKSHVRSAANDLGVGYVALSHHVRKKLGVNRLEEARGRPKKAAAKDYTVHPVTKEKLMHNNPEHMKRIEKLQKSGALEKPKTEAGQHIINQLRKASTSMQGGATVHFTHGESKHVTAAHAGKALDKYASMKPSEKEDYQKKIGHSHEQLMKHI